MRTAWVFPGQGSQFTGMGKDLWESDARARQMFARADAVLGFNLSEVMFYGSDADLKATRVTQPAVFLHSVVAACCSNLPSPAMVAGHSLGEFSALVCSGVLEFEDALRLVSIRAEAMQQSCDMVPSSMAAVIGLDDAIVEAVCARMDGVVVPANYNCPSQVVISGEKDAVERCCQAMKAEGAKRALVLPVGGAFHSPIMASARERLAEGIEKTSFHHPSCPVYQNVTGLPYTDPAIIRENLLSQLTSPVRWTDTVRNMASDGAGEFIEFGPGNVLKNLISRILK